MEIGVLGPAVAVVDGVERDLGAAKQRALLAVLALHLRESVSTSTIVEALWGEDPPPSDTVTLQGYVYALRKVLEPDRAPRAPATVVVTTHTGYALRLPDEALDSRRLEAAVRRAARVVLAVPGAPWDVDPQVPPHDLSAARQEITAALEAWRGEPYAELADLVDARAERVRLADVRVEAMEHQAALDLVLGDHAAAVTTLETVTAAHPHRERPCLLQAVALVRSGRQADALDAIRALRGRLRDDLGIDPGPAVRDLETAILRQDEALLAPRPSPPTSPPTDVRPAPDPWPLVGRDAERAVLRGVLDEAQSGTPQLVQLIGEPGIGKSRLAREVVQVATGRGFVCAEAFCSQDEGAPPLWPWMSLLDALSRRTGVPVPDLRGAAGSQFALWESIAEAVAAMLAEHAVVLAIDDIHWADPSSLRALRHLVDVTPRGRLVVVTTRRTHPAPVDAQASLADAFARRHSVRIELAGLDEAASTELLGSVSPDRRSATEVARLLERTEGNPFFLIELARAGDSVPGSVRDVVARRVGELPLESRDLLAAAAVLGRRFRLDALALATGRTDLLDLLLPAIEVGLVLDSEEVGVARFSHPLVQDVVVGRVPGVHRSALHAGAAQALAALPDVPASDLARHWRRAGPEHAAACAEAATTAAAEAREVAAHEEEVELLGWAIEALSSVAGTDDRVLYDLQMARGRAARWGGLWTVAEQCVAEAVALADRLGDHEALARAALSTVEGAVWYANSFGEVNAFLIDTLERVLAGLPPEDSELRCRVLLSLGIELYFCGEPERVRAYIDDAVDMARRLDDSALLQVVLHGACYGNWRPASAPQRAGLAAEAVALATATGDRRALALALAAEASAAAEVGDVTRMWAAIGQGRVVAEELNLVAVVVFLEALELPWLVLGGQEDRARAALPRLRDLASRVAIPNVAAALAHTALVSGLSDVDDADGMQDEQVLELAAVPTVSAHAVVYARRGDVDVARRIVDAHRERFVAEHDDFMSMMRWCYGAELALVLADAELAAISVRALAPYSGRSCSAAQIGADGPVDVYRALAAAAAGDRAGASQIADLAARQCADWHVPRAGERLARHRAAHGF